MQAMENLAKDVANTIAERTINPETKRPYTATMFLSSLTIGLKRCFLIYILTSARVKTRSNCLLKPLSLILFDSRAIQAGNSIPIARVRVRVQICLQSQVAKKIKETLVSFCHLVESEVWGDNLEMV